eukprot:gb/GEZN01019228.1/.p1 GENE.gb/GEZN01019228.1/~~gb/GEZN01019228.1/.p1  ORF type:complete len:138 (+),score=7.27 gb/GEZN01019228.1/:153-566(+)
MPRTRRRTCSFVLLLVMVTISAAVADKPASQVLSEQHVEDILRDPSEETYGGLLETGSGVASGKHGGQFSISKSENSGENKVVSASIDLSEAVTLSYGAFGLLILATCLVGCLFSYMTNRFLCKSCNKHEDEGYAEY